MSENLKGRDHMGYTYIVGRINIKRNSKEMWCEDVGWIRIGTSDVCL